MEMVARSDGLCILPGYGQAGTVYSIPCFPRKDRNHCPLYSLVPSAGFEPATYRFVPL